MASQIGPESRPDSTIHIIADRGDARLRLDQVLIRRVTTVSALSRRLAQQWIKAGMVAVDGRTACRPAAAVHERSQIVVSIPPETRLREHPRAQERELDIVYEDEWLMAINKPAGLVVHPSYKNKSGTVLNAVLWHVRNREEARPGLVSRLDKDTSGLVLVALNSNVHAQIQRDGEQGRLIKEYLALVRATPRPARGRITTPLARDPHDRRRMIPASDGAASETRYETVSKADGVSLLRCQLVTGRTHQIRVHLASRGWPIVGDSLYGVADDAVSRQALHAWRLVLPHPVSRETLEIQSGVPDDLPLMGRLFSLGVERGAG